MRFWFLCSVFLLTACSAINARDSSICSHPNRLSCRSIFSAAECELLDECGMMWRNAQWVNIREDLSANCTYCRYVTSMGLFAPKVLKKRILYDSICRNFTKKDQCEKFLLLLSRYDTVKDGNYVVCNLVNACYSHLPLGFLSFGSSVCNDCKKIFSDIQQLVRENETAEAVTLQLEQLVCDPLPNALKPYCKDVIKAHVPSLLKMIEQQIDPNEMCTLIGLCSAQSTLHNKPALKDTEPTCCECKDVMKTIQDSLSAPSFVAELKKDLDEKICDGISICVQLLNEHFDSMIEGLRKADLQGTCAFFGMCGQAVTVPKKPAVRVTSQVALQPAIPIPGVCHVCEIIAEKLIDLFVAQPTEESIAKALDEACLLVPSLYRDRCTKFVEKYGAKIVEAIIKGTAPKLLCASFGLCSSNSPRKPLLVVPTVQSSSYCDLCKTLTNAIYLAIKQNYTEEQIERFVSGVCGYVPSSYTEKCHIFVKDYLPRIIDYFEENLTPEQICEKLSICAARDNPNLCWDPAYFCSSLQAAEQCQTSALCNSLGLTQTRAHSQQGAQARSVLRLVCRERVRQQNGTVCQRLLRVWNLQMALFGAPVVRSQDCEKYNASAGDLMQCLMTVAHKDRLLLELRKNGENYDDACKLMYSDVPGGNRVFVPPKSRETPHKSQLPCPRPRTEFSWISRPSEAHAAPMWTSYSSSAELTKADCGACQRVMHKIKTDMAERAFQGKVKDMLDHALCGDSFSCKLLLNQVLGPVLNKLSQFDECQACARFNMCSNCPQPVTVEPIWMPGTQELHNFAQFFDCSTCKTLVRAIYDQLEKNVTEAEIKAFLKKGCMHLPERYQIACTSMVDQYLDIVFHYFAMMVPPEEVCKEFGLCRSRAGRCSTDPVKSCADLETAIRCDTVAHCQALGLTANLLTPIRDPHLAEKVDQVCSHQPRTPEPHITPTFLQPHRLLMSRFREFLGRISKKDDSASCAVCSRLLTDWKLEQVIYGRYLAAGDDACKNYAEGQEKEECTTAVNAQAALMAEALSTDDSNRKVCQRLLSCDRECSDPTVKCGSKEKAEFCESVDECVALGYRLDPSSCKDVFDQDCCVWGPEYYCQSEQTARTCGQTALEHCRKKVWRQRSMCSRGPVFWCRSEENAKSCGPLATAYCKAMVLLKPRW